MNPSFRFFSYLTFLSAGILAGCASDPLSTKTPESVILREAQTTSDALAKSLKGRLAAVQDTKRVSLSESVLVSSLVDVNDVASSSPFGRIFAEQMAAAFAQRGLAVTELKMADVIRMGNPRGVRGGNRGWDEGEFVLSRNAQDLADQRGATTIIAGTYAVGSEEVLVSVRALDAKSGRILAARNFSVPYSIELFQGGRLIR